MINPERKKNIMNDYRINDKDTGSIELQVAMLTDRINQLNKHLSENKHDYASQVGLMKLVGRRRRFLRYLARTNPVTYKNIIARLGLRA